jgi:hypothetical protein
MSALDPAARHSRAVILTTTPISNRASISSAARLWSAALYSTTGRQCACLSKLPILLPVSNSIAINRVVAGGVQHPALDFMGSLQC